MSALSLNRQPGAFIARGMRAEGYSRGTALLSAGDRFAARPGLLARMIAPGIDAIIERIDAGLHTGAIHGTLPDGSARTVGGRAPGFVGEMAIYDWRALLRVATSGSIGLYQGWEAGEWSSPDPVQIFALFMANADTLGTVARARGPFRWAARLAHWFNRNTHAGARRNIDAHYDLGNDFYAAWLGRTMCYSSALFAPADEPSKAQ